MGSAIVPLGHWAPPSCHSEWMTAGLSASGGRHDPLPKQGHCATSARKGNAMATLLHYRLNRPRRGGRMRRDEDLKSPKMLISGETSTPRREVRVRSEIRL